MERRDIKVVAGAAALGAAWAVIVRLVLYRADAWFLLVEEGRWLAVAWIEIIVIR